MSWEEIGLKGGVKGVVLAESQTRDFLVGFQEQAAASQLDLSSLLLGLAQQQQGKWRGTPGRPETAWLRDFAAGFPLEPWTSAWLHGRVQAGGCPPGCKGGTPLPGLPFLLPPVDSSDMGHGKAATVEGLTWRSCPAGSSRCFF